MVSVAKYFQVLMFRLSLAINHLPVYALPRRFRCHCASRNKCIRCRLLHGIQRGKLHFNRVKLLNFEVGLFLQSKNVKILIANLSLQLTGSTHLPGQYVDSPLLESSLVDHFSGLPRSLIEKLYQIYYDDFLLFNYSIDEFIEVADSTL